jgi:hypothetical protein
MQEEGVPIPEMTEEVFRIPTLREMVLWLAITVSLVRLGKGFKNARLLGKLWRTSRIWGKLGSLTQGLIGVIQGLGIAIELWAGDASQYFNEPGLTGSELVDDVLGIIFPLFWIVDFIIDLGEPILNFGEQIIQFSDQMTSAIEFAVNAWYTALGLESLIGDSLQLDVSYVFDILMGIPILTIESTAKALIEIPRAIGYLISFIGGCMVFIEEWISNNIREGSRFFIQSGGGQAGGPWYIPDTDGTDDITSEELTRRVIGSYLDQAESHIRTKLKELGYNDKQIDDYFAENSDILDIDMYMPDSIDYTKFSSDYTKLGSIPEKASPRKLVDIDIIEDE